MEEKEKKKVERVESMQSKSEEQQFSSQKPWWFVGILFLLLTAFGAYIWWLNSPFSKTYPSLWAYLVGPRHTEIVSDSSLSQRLESGSGNDFTTLDQMVADSVGKSWEKGDTKTQPVGTGSNLTPSSAAFSSTEPSVATPTYFIKAGEFKTKGSALFRIRELRQGNYAAKLVEPPSPDGNYVVSVGEFKNYKTASSKSKEINFILEINSSVEKKE